MVGERFHPIGQVHAEHAGQLDRGLDHPCHGVPVNGGQAVDGLDHKVDRGFDGLLDPVPNLTGLFRHPIPIRGQGHAAGHHRGEEQHDQGERAAGDAQRRQRAGEHTDRQGYGADDDRQPAQSAHDEHNGLGQRGILFDPRLDALQQ